MAGIGLFDVEFGLDASRPFAEHDDTGSEKHRLLDVVGHENGGEAFPAPEGHQLLLQRQTRQRIELAERLIEQQQGGIVDERAGERGALRHAARELMRIGLGEVAQVRQGRARNRRDVALASTRRARRARSRHCSRPSPTETASDPERRESATDPACRSAILRPKWTQLVGCSRPEMSRSSVDLPHPDGPSSATNSPAATERSIELEHRQPRAVEFERVAHAANVDCNIARRGRRSAQRRCGRRHQMNPFCQPSRRSRATNKSLTMPAQMRAMMTSVA